MQLRPLYSDFNTLKDFHVYKKAYFDKEKGKNLVIPFNHSQKYCYFIFKFIFFKQKFEAAKEFKTKNEKENLPLNGKRHYWHINSQQINQGR